MVKKIKNLETIVGYHSLNSFISFSLYIYVCVCARVCVCVRERERERERERDQMYLCFSNMMMLHVLIRGCKPSLYNI